MTAKIMISVSDDLKIMIDEYNRTHMFKKLHISEICQQAIYDFISKDTPSAEQIKKNLIDSIIEAQKQPKKQTISEEDKLFFEAIIEGEKQSKQQEILEDTDKPTIPCPICGKMFVQTIPTRKFCSKNCGTQASRMRKRAQGK